MHRATCSVFTVFLTVYWESNGNKVKSWWVQDDDSGWKLTPQLSKHIFSSSSGIFGLNIKIHVIFLEILYICDLVLQIISINHQPPWLTLQRGFYASAGKSFCHYITLLAHYFDRGNDSDDDTTIHILSCFCLWKKSSVILAVGLRLRFVDYI